MDAMRMRAAMATLPACLGLALPSACAGTGGPAAPGPHSSQGGAPGDPPGLCIDVDPRMEALGLMHVFSGYYGGQALDSPYRNTAMEKLAGILSQEDLDYLRRIKKAGFNADAPVESLLSLSAYPPYPDQSPDRIHNLVRIFPYSIRKFKAIARKFLSHPAFIDFLEESSPLYAESIRVFRESSRIDAYIQALEALCGAKLGRYFIYLAPSLVNQGFGFRLERREAGGKTQSEGYAILSPAGYGPGATGLPAFNFESEAIGFFMLHHELAHAFINPLRARIDYAAVFSDVRIDMGAMRSRGYPDEKTAMLEATVSLAALRACRDVSPALFEKEARHLAGDPFAFCLEALAALDARLGSSWTLADILKAP